MLCLVAFLLGCSLWLFLGLRGDTIGWDFRAFYVAGKVPLASLYDQAVFKEYGRETFGGQGTDYYPPYVRPAIFAVPLRILSSLPFWHAFMLWYLLQLGVFASSLHLLYRWFRVPIELLPAFGLFAPAVYGPVFGQDPNTVAFLLVASLVLLLRKKEWAAGLLLALTTYKFHTVLLLPLSLALKRRYRALGWMCAGGLVLALASVVLASPFSYLRLLRTMDQYVMGAGDDKSISLRSITHFLGWPPLFYLLGAGVLVRSVWAIPRLDLPRAISVALLGSFLITSHLGAYDAASLLIPLFLAFRSECLRLQIIAGSFLVLFPIWPAWINAVLLLLMFFGLSTSTSNIPAEEESLSRE